MTAFISLHQSSWMKVGGGRWRGEERGAHVKQGREEKIAEGGWE